MNSPIRLPLVALWAGILGAPYCGVLSVQAESLQVQSVERISEGQIRIIFFDSGTGASGYRVETSDALAPNANWTEDSQAQIQAQDGDSHAVTVATSGRMGFFRIVALSGDGEIVAGLSSDSIQIDEGAGTLDIHIDFNRPYEGTLFYTVSGSTDPDNIEPVSGEVQVNGTAATITIQLVDNTNLNELRYLVLDLRPEAGYTVGRRNQATVIIRDDDTLWSGNFHENGTPAGFSLKLLGGSSGESGFLVGRGDGLFPEGEFAVQVERTSSRFDLSIDSVSLPADATLFGVPAELSLTLSAENGEPGQAVEDARIEGEAALTIAFPSQPHLNTNLAGPFLLIQQVIHPSSRKVQLTNN